MATTQENIQRLYIAYFGRPADPVGLQYWVTQVDVNKQSLQSVASNFALSPEYQVNFTGLSNAQAVNNLYLNLFSRAAEPAGLLYWAGELQAGRLTIANVALAISNGALGNDIVALNAKISASQTFTTALSDTSSEILGYSLNNPTALAIGRAYVNGVTDAATLGTATAPAALQATTDLIANIGSPGQTYTLTSNVDSFTGGANNDSFVSTSGAANFAILDTIDGGAGNDNLQYVQTTAINLPAGTVSVKNVETAALTSGATLTANVSGWTGLTKLTTIATGGTDLTAATTTGVTVANTNGITLVTGGSNVNVTSSGGSSTTVTGAVGNVVVAAAGGTTSVTGGANVTLTASAVGNGITTTVTGATGNAVVSATSTGAVTAGAINVGAAGTVAVTQAVGNAVNTTAGQAAVTVTGGANTTSVSVTNAKAATASSTVAGVTTNTVVITDVNNTSTTKVGVLTDVTVSGYSSLSINDTGLVNLSASNGGFIGIFNNNGPLATPAAANKTLNLTLDNVNGLLADQGQITTWNITTGASASTLSNIASIATALNVKGASNLTLTSVNQSALIKTVTVSGAAGLTADLSVTAATSVDTSATTGTSTLTIDSSKATFTGGAGVDNVTTSSTTVTKAISLGDGNDSLTLATGTLATGLATITGGAGTDTLTLAAADAASLSGATTFAGKVSGFETLNLTAITTQTIDLAKLGNYTNVVSSGTTGTLTLNGFANGGTLTINADSIGGAHLINNTAFTAGKADVVNLVLTKAGLLNAGTVVANDVETINITTADTATTPTNPFDVLALVANSATTTLAIAGNAGLNLGTLTGATGLTSVDASGITKGDFTFTSDALASAAVIKGSATGVNTIDFTLAADVVTYTGGTGADNLTFTAANASDNVITLGAGANNVLGLTFANGANTVTAGAGDDIVRLGSGNNKVTLGDGTNIFQAGAGNNTYTGGADGDAVTLTSGNNVVNAGNGTNSFTATTGANTYTGGSGVDTVTVGGGVNTLTLGAGADRVNFTAVNVNGNSYSTITDAAAADTISFVGVTAVTSTQAGALGARITLANTAVFQDFLDAAVAGDGTGAGGAIIRWFQFNGDTYVVVDNSSASTYQNANGANGDFVVKLTGTINLATSTITGEVLTLV